MRIKELRDGILKVIDMVAPLAGIGSTIDDFKEDMIDDQRTEEELADGVEQLRIWMFDLRTRNIDFPDRVEEISKALIELNKVSVYGQRVIEKRRENENK